MEQDYKTSDEEVYQSTLRLLKERGVTTWDIAELVHFLQSKYFSKITIDICEQHVKKVLMKREVQNAVITGIQLDKLAEKQALESPLLEMLIHDESLYGIDEIISLSIVNVYGSIGFTNYGYIDKMKPGILAKLNEHENGQVNTFLDDIVGAIAAAASSRIAHNWSKIEKE
ncbi:phosphatidylglycerophosphatase A [Vulcanibacillus modesticaldus]|uniref:Phosphatidylglycerophosphatase A n=1 Tax=Vulcanibacillus modesticaldus TaxID=337097 RepID=A0A1D2YUH1_9BACI|nr:phosphatidylglycerophosphatase A [Vulcanibacillus modesticaldus]OEF99358.1 phosphatidylglycerophosphatase A [Vulcanibacillus modesticaldus]